MPVILHEKDYWRWLGAEPDLGDLRQKSLMTAWFSMQHRISGKAT